MFSVGLCSLFSQFPIQHAETGSIGGGDWFAKSHIIDWLVTAGRAAQTKSATVVYRNRCNSSAENFPDSVPPVPTNVGDEGISLLRRRNLVPNISLRTASRHKWRSEANYLVIRTKRDELSEIFNVGRYIDTVRRMPEGLMFKSRLCIFDSELIKNSIIYPI